MQIKLVYLVAASLVCVSQVGLIIKFYAAKIASHLGFLFGIQERGPLNPKTPQYQL